MLCFLSENSKVCIKKRLCADQFEMWFGNLDMPCEEMTMGEIGATGVRMLRKGFLLHCRRANAA